MSPGRERTASLLSVVISTSQQMIVWSSSFIYNFIIRLNKSKSHDRVVTERQKYCELTQYCMNLFVGGIWLI